MSTEANAQIISVIGGCRRAGRWLVPSKTKVMTFFGRATIDLREAQTSADELAFDCMSAFASITFIVPEGAEVRPSGVAILASARSDVPVEVGGCHLPRIAIDAVTLFGRFRVVTGEALEAEQNDEAQVAGAGADLADTPRVTADVPAFVPPSDPAPYVPTSDPAPYVPASDPAPFVPPGDASDENTETERSPIHDVSVPDSPAAMTLDERPGPYPEPTPVEDEAVAEAEQDLDSETDDAAAVEDEPIAENEQAEDVPA